MMAKGHEHSACSELLEHLNDYVDGELSASLCAELEVHLAECPNCRVMVDTVRKTITLYHAQAAKALPSDVEERLYKVLKLAR
jgi:anti-sigma factor (TIGR02949 family)